MNSDRPENNYTPISCANYDQYEIAILHGNKLQLTWQVDNVIYNQVVTPLNLRTAHFRFRARYVTLVCHRVDDDVDSERE